MKVVTGVAGAGTMGSGIAQVAAQSGHQVFLYDPFPQALEKAKGSLSAILKKLEEKGRLGEEKAVDVLGRIQFTSKLEDLSPTGLVIEAILEDLYIKKELFQNLEEICSADTILATNTSSLSVASIAASVKEAKRVIGLHFFNPAPLMPLVEVIPAIQTSPEIVETSKKLLLEWKKIPVLAKDTPGFIVNRVARPFYGEALRILEEGIATIPQIDRAMKENAGFRMGPFELMDYIGNDINYTVTETVFREFFYDPRYKPSFTQKRMMEAGYLGRKTSRGYYNYSEGAVNPEADPNPALEKEITERILAMLINEAADALYLNIASKEDLDLAMTKGVNYPKGLLKWADEIGIQKVLRTLETLQSNYGEDRYRPSFLLKKMAATGEYFYKKEDATA